MRFLRAEGKRGLVREKRGFVKTASQVQLLFSAKNTPINSSGRCETNIIFMATIGTFPRVSETCIS